MFDRCVFDEGVYLCGCPRLCSVTVSNCSNQIVLRHLSFRNLVLKTEADAFCVEISSAKFTKMFVAGSELTNQEKFQFRKMQKTIRSQLNDVGSQQVNICPLDFEMQLGSAVATGANADRAETPSSVASRSFSFLSTLKSSTVTRASRRETAMTLGMWEKEVDERLFNDLRERAGGSQLSVCSSK